MAALKASVNLFAVLDVNDPGDKRLADLDAKPQKKPPMSTSTIPMSDYKLKLKEAASKANKKPSPSAAAAASKANKQKPSPSAAAAASKANKQKPSPSAAAAASKANKQKPSPSAAAAASKANKKPTPAKGHGGGHYDKGAPRKEQPGVAVNQVPVAAAPEQTPPPPPSPPRLDDMAQFPSLK